MASYLLSAVGPDQPGIVAAVTRALAGIGCNLGESRMTNLHGQFAIMVALEAANGVDAAVIDSTLEDIGSRFDLVLATRPIGSIDPHDSGGLVGVSVHGADHPGIVASITDAIASAGGNIVDLATRSSRSKESTTYVMVLTVALSDDVARDVFSEDLSKAANELGVRCSVTPIDDDVL